MDKEQAKKLFYKLSNSFGGRENEGITMSWADYLPKQDFSMAKATVDYFIYQSGNKFMPTISEFNRQLREIQIQHSLSEVNRVDASACRRCDGLTWERSGDDAFIPCRVCRPVAYSRWEAGDYLPGALSNQNELEGPTQAYALPARPQYPPQKPVSPERARQWARHIQAKTGYVFPEDVPFEDTSPVVEDTSMVDGETGEIISSDQSLDAKFDQYLDMLNQDYEEEFYS